MRKLFSILLVAMFGLPFVSPLLALGQGGGAELPMCCRRNGKHHCAAGMGERAEISGEDPQLRAPRERCPYCPASVPANHTSVMAAAGAGPLLYTLTSGSARVAQAELERRISRDRSRQMRGPPGVLLF